MAGYPIMSKIRINELARELEVKPNVILDLLPELGVMDKKTHSSSLDDDVALQIRQRVTGGNGSRRPAVEETAEPAHHYEEIPAAPMAEALPALPVVKPEPAPRLEAKA